tara:strand:+ start:292 stop:471 length:180 start_codon:yes stop_codon:yes gene_type:complete
MSEQQRELSNNLYELAMRLTDAKAKGVDKLIQGLCQAAGISYPPEQLKANERPVTLEFN